MKLNFPTNPISIRNGEYIINLKTGINGDYIAEACINCATNTKLADYQLFYRSNHKGHSNAVVYLDFKMSENSEASLYFKDVHSEEIQQIVDSHSINIDRFLIYDGYIVQIFYWKLLGYDAIGLDFENNNDMIELKELLQEELADMCNYEDASKFYSEFEKKFIIPDYEFASKCEKVMKSIGFPHYLVDSVKDVFSKDIKARYICEKVL